MNRPRGGAAPWTARLSTPGSPVCLPGWLALREDADAAARAPELVELLRAHLESRPGSRSRPTVIRDLGCGTGSMGRWLAGRLCGRQVWMLHDRDPTVLASAVAGLPSSAADGARVVTRIQHGDLTDLRAEEIAGTSLVTASALLDLLSAKEVEGLASACVEAACAALLTLTVTGRVDITPADELDEVFAAAFNAHQQRSTGGRRLLGPAAADAAVDAFVRRGAMVRTRPSPWCLGADQGELAEEWLRGWISAACEQQAALERHAAAYLRRRLGACMSGELRIAVGHRDVLALPPGP